MTGSTLRVLIADDAPDVLHLLEFHLKKQKFESIPAATGREALDRFRDSTPDLAIIDIQMPEMTGLEVLEAILKENPAFPVIIMTADTRVPRVVEAMKLGAWDFLPKPFDTNVLQVTLRQAAEQIRLRKRVQNLTAQLDDLEGYQGLVANSRGMKRALRLLRQAVDSSATVLLLGESGTGKGVLARELHRMGPRCDGPFIAVNCAAIPEQLLESELFGHEKGAFTGASARRIGKFEAAQGGIIFLDEIGEMPLALQAKLLRVLQDREVVRIGSNESIPLDVRVVAATNADLDEQMQRNDFREDLYYRLAVLEIPVPPLRDRRDDIAELAAQFLERASRDEGREVTTIAPDALEALQQFDFPGNIRQLENIVTRAVIVADGDTVTIDDLPPSMLKRLKKLRRGEILLEMGDEESAVLTGGKGLLASAGAGLALKITGESDIPKLADLELAIMRRALDLCEGNMTKAAKRLGIGRATLYRRMDAAREAGDLDDE